MRDYLVGKQGSNVASGEGSNEREDVPPVIVSTASAWEIGIVIAHGRLPTTQHALTWFDDFVHISGVSVQDATSSIMIAASYLPAPLHKDPMDRIIIATAREHDLTIITRDRAILAYGAAGHVKTLAC